jgi:hypothetical protein
VKSTHWELKCSTFWLNYFLKWNSCPGAPFSKTLNTEVWTSDIFLIYLKIKLLATKLLDKKYSLGSTTNELVVTCTLFCIGNGMSSWYEFIFEIIHFSTLHFSTLKMCEFTYYIFFDKFTHYITWSKKRILVRKNWVNIC